MTDNKREITLRFLAPVVDINILGKVHGGAVMKWMDEAAYAVAAAWSGHHCVTVYEGGSHFRKLIPLPSMVEVYARLIYTGNTSMHVAVNVRSRDPRKDDFTETTSCIMVYVALDDDGNPMTAPAWKPETERDKALAEYAAKLVDMRKDIEEERRKILSE